MCQGGSVTLLGGQRLGCLSVKDEDRLNWMARRGMAITQYTESANVTCWVRCLPEPGSSLRGPIWRAWAMTFCARSASPCCVWSGIRGYLPLLYQFVAYVNHQLEVEAQLVYDVFIVKCFALREKFLDFSLCLSP